MSDRRNPSRRPAWRIVALFGAICLLAAAPAARGEVELTLFAGHAAIPDSDLRLTRPDGTDLLFEGAGLLSGRPLPDYDRRSAPGRVIRTGR